MMGQQNVLPDLNPEAGQTLVSPLLVWENYSTEGDNC
jgi:hypothetical protein